jgi:acyl-coenzyme A thioesterase PaaI-like protein
MCFVCGRENPLGLRMEFVEDHSALEVRANLVVPDEFQSYPGVVHGGIVAAMLDETAGRTVLLDGSDDDFMATLRLTVRYRMPTPTGVPLTVVGRLERRSGTGARARGEVRLPDGSVTAECECLLADVPAEFLDRWEAEKQYWIVDG